MAPRPPIFMDTQKLHLALVYIGRRKTQDCNRQQAILELDLPIEESAYVAAVAQMERRQQ